MAGKVCSFDRASRSGDRFVKHKEVILEEKPRDGPLVELRVERGASAQERMDLAKSTDDVIQ